MRPTFSRLSFFGFTLGFVLGAVALAPPSQAALPSGCTGTLVDSLVSGSIAVGDSVTMTVTCVITAADPTTVITGFTGDVTATATSLMSGGTVTVTSANPAAASAGVATFTIRGSSAGTAQVVFSNNGRTQNQLFTVTSGGGGGGSGGGGGGTSSAAAASAPVEVSLSLDLAASGASCTEGSAASGTTGSWLKLPGAGDCSSKTEPKATLLGWATTADFPVEIAQRQIRNGWGAYEMFDSEGRMTAVFIPAGQATFVSGPNSLHPVWAK